MTSFTITCIQPFTHDCEHCSLLGHYIDQGKQYDLYICEVDTLVARYSSEGPDYTSVSTEDITYLRMVLKRDIPLLMAFKLWVTRN